MSNITCCLRLLRDDECEKIRAARAPPGNVTSLIRMHVTIEIECLLGEVWMSMKFWWRLVKEWSGVGGVTFSWSCLVHGVGESPFLGGAWFGEQSHSQIENILIRFITTLR
jgi:hypothetical protein